MQRQRSSRHRAGRRERTVCSWTEAQATYLNIVFLFPCVFTFTVTPRPPGRPAPSGTSMPASFSNVLLPSLSPLRLTQPIVAARPASHSIAAIQQRESLRAARDLLEAREALENRRRLCRPL